MDFKAFREHELKMERAQFALFLDVSEDEIILWESTNEPPMDILQKLAKKTGIPFLKLIRYQAEENETVTKEKTAESDRPKAEEMNGRDIYVYLDSLLAQDQYKNNPFSGCLIDLKSELDEIAEMTFDEEELPEVEESIHNFLVGFILDNIDTLKFAREEHEKVLCNRNVYIELMRKVAINEPDRISTAKIQEEQITKLIEDLQVEFGKKLDEIFDIVLDQQHIINFIHENHFKNTKKDGEKIYEEISNELIEVAVSVKNEDLDKINQAIKDYVSNMDHKIDEPYSEIGIEKPFDWDYVYDSCKQDLIDYLNEQEDENEEEVQQQQKPKIGLKDIGLGALIAINAPNPFFWLGVALGNIGWEKDIAKAVNEVFRGGWKTDILTAVQDGFEYEKIIFQNTADMVKDRWEGQLATYDELVKKNDEEINVEINRIQLILDTLRIIGDRVGVPKEEEGA